MDPSTFDYLAPTEPQMQDMHELRGAFRELSTAINALVPDGPDKTHAMRMLRTASMWCNVAITRQPDGAARR